MVGLDILQVIDQENKSLHEVCTDFIQRYRQPLLSMKVSDPDMCISAIEKLYSNYDIQHIDGINIFAADMRLTVRKSNTEPKIRIALETKDANSRQIHMDRILQSIQI
jgi:phosphomannomutase